MSSERFVLYRKLISKNRFVYVARVVDRFGSICSNLTPKTSKPFFFGTLSKLADLHGYKLYSDQRRFYISVKSTM